MTEETLTERLMVSIKYLLTFKLIVKRAKRREYSMQWLSAQPMYIYTVHLYTGVGQYMQRNVKVFSVIILMMLILELF